MAFLTLRADSVPSVARDGSTSNLLTVQALRAVAALLVVLYHALEVWGERIDPTAPGVGWTNGAAGVDIFFVISGFVMVVSSRRPASKPDAWLIFLRHRIVRIVPLYWLLTTVKVAAVALLSGLVLRTSLDVNFVVGSYLFLPVVDSANHFRPVLPVGWTLTYEFMFYLLFAVALAARVGVLRIIVPGLGLIAALALVRTQSWPPWTILFNTIVLEFIFGVLLAKWTLLGFRLRPIIATGFVIAGFVAILCMPLVSENARVLTWGLPAFAIVVGAVSLEPVARLPRWLLALGDASYSIYLCHGFVLPTLVLLIGSTVSPGLLIQATTTTLCLFVGSGIGWVVFMLIEGPMLRTFRQGRVLAEIGPAQIQNRN
jgi:peptidoglycan/LPS O-acetylase OafA/YrhL